MKAPSLIAFALMLLAACPAWGESLMDVKVEELRRPVKSRWGKDPFIRFNDRQALAEKETYLPKFKVEGIMTDGTKALAIISGGFYRKGDVIGGFVIEDIRADRLILKRNGQSYTLKIQGFTVRGGAMEAGR